ncbi:hypothetical protein Cni_G07776 [Canna indica]|uniref:Uncharacterized protein n=1 Tax=Canna indica TaxID=4628 RepID=A0AAQ3JZ36_9LILI|nr:hypothetical protein Cni_G07776 [Canna indica]
MAASCCKPSYQRLKRLPAEATEEEEEFNSPEVCRGRRSGWLRLSRRRRPAVRVTGLRRFLRRKARVVRAAVAKVIKRLKEGRSHFGELFAGNYMFMQVSPSPTLPFMEKTSILRASAAAAAKNHYQHGFLPPPTTIRFNVPKAAS